MPLFLFFLLSFRAQRANLLPPVLRSCHPKGVQAINEMARSVLAYNAGDDTIKKREKAGSLATLGMTTRKAKNKTPFHPITKLPHLPTSAAH